MRMLIWGAHYCENEYCNDCGCHYSERDTIEITDEEWDEIELQWRRHWPHHFDLTFSRYLRELIELAGAK